MSDPRGYTIQQIDPSALPAEQLEPVAWLRQAVDHERVPEDPLTPLEVYVRRMRIKPPSQWSAVFEARDREGAVAGFGHVGYGTNEPEQAHLRWTELNVGADHRRRGIGRALFRRIVEAVNDQGDGLVFIGQGNDRVPAGEAFARSLGATPGLPMRINQLVLAEVDRATLAEWAAIAPADYRLEWVTDAGVPQSLMPAYLQAVNGMNDAPKGDIDFGEWKATEQQQREREDWLRQAGIEPWVIVAVHETTGAGAGFTAVSYDPKVPHVIQQQGTATVSAHRGHRIGMWMKATMLERILAERPQAMFVRTGNANVNQQMLDINTKLGFRHAWQSTLWQMKLAEARKAVGLETVESRP